MVIINASNAWLSCVAAGKKRATFAFGAAGEGGGEYADFMSLLSRACKCETKCSSNRLFTAFGHDTWLWRQQTFGSEESKGRYMRDVCSASKQRLVQTNQGKMVVCNAVFMLTLGIGRDRFGTEMRRSDGTEPRRRLQHLLQAKLEGRLPEDKKCKLARAWILRYTETRGIRLRTSNQREVRRNM